MERDWVIPTYKLECVMGRAAGAHVVFGMDFEKSLRACFGTDRRQMFRLEARARQAVNRIEGKAELGTRFDDRSDGSILGIHLCLLRFPMAVSIRGRA
jgi:hypothetical protein